MRDNAFYFESYFSEKVLLSEQDECLVSGISEAEYMTHSIVSKISIVDYWAREDTTDDVPEKIFIEPLVEMLQGIAEVAVP